MVQKTTPTDEAISGALADVVMELQRRRYGELSAEIDQGLAAWIDSFATRLEDHLRHEEAVLFRALREADPACFVALEQFEGDHQMFRQEIREAAALFRKGDIAEAYQTARDLLARILEHSHEETREVGRAVKNLDPISAIVFERGVKSGETETRYGGGSTS